MCPEENEPALPVGAAPIEPTPEPAEGGAPEPQAEEEIRIGDRSFKTQAEAFAYAQEELSRKDMEIQIAEAYRTGIADASQANAPIAAAPEPEDPAAWEQKFYADPKGTLSELRASIEADLEKKILGRVAGQTEEQKIWAEFYAKHPDLEGFDDDVLAVSQKHAEEIRALAKTKGRPAAIDYLAQKTKAKFQAYNEKQKPRSALPNAPAASTPRGQTNVTPQQGERKILSFVEQARSIKR